MNLNDLFNEEKVRLDPKCWTGKKIGNPKTKMKGGVRVNNCVPAESVAEQSSASGTANDINTSGAKNLTKKALGKVGRTVMPTLGFTDAAERLSNKDYTGAGISAAAGGIGLIPAWPAQVASGGLELVNMARDEANALGGYDKLAKEISKNFTPEYDPSYLPENPTQSEGLGTLYNRGKDFVKYLRRDSGITSQDIATQRSVGGKEIPSLGQAGKVVTSPTVDQALTKLGGKNVSTTPGPTVKSGSSNDLNLDPVFDVPAYVRQGKSDPVTVPKPGSKPTIKIQPGETMIQAMQRAKDEQEFGKFLQGQGGQSFGTPGGGRGTANPEPAKQQVFPEPKTDTQVKWDNYKEKYGVTHPDKLVYDLKQKQKAGPTPNPEMEKIIKKWDQENQPVKSKGQRPWGTDIEEQSRKKRKEPEVDYHAIDHDKSVARLRHLAGIGPMKTVWDPAKRVYKNVPTADQPPKK